MYFKRLEMHGFKSFVEPVVIDFHEGVTCVVGPNGSGKSNISDAIRWVLGEQSPKTLRGGKMEDVIFSGTESRKARGMAQVTLVIDNSTKILPIDYNEVAITRRMYRSGEGEYLINNNQCRLRDIKELIMDTGIGVDGYSVIGQGKIADIVSNKPESRREIFEEAAGVVMYKNRKTEATRKLSNSQANLDRANDIIAELEDRMGPLEEESRRAQEYLEISRRYKELEINITLRSIERLESANSALKESVEGISGELERLQEEKDSADAKVAQARRKSEDLDLLGSQKKDLLIEKNKELNEISSQSKVSTERLSNIDKDTKRLSDEIDEINIRLEEELRAAEEMEESQRRLTGDKEAFEQVLSEKVEAYNAVQREFSDLEAQLDGLKQDLFRGHSDVSTKTAEMDNLRSYRDTFETRQGQLDDEESRGDEAESRQREEYEAAKTERAEAASVLEQVAAEMKALLDRSAEISGELRGLDLKIDDLRIKISGLASRRRTIEEMESNYEGYNSAVRFIMKSGIKGLDGVVADLMEVPEGYEVAVETALGGALQNIVCQRDENAKEAINLLKSKNAGRLTFLPLESVKGGRSGEAAGLAGKDGFLGLATDIISCEKRYEKVFEYLLGRVAVVKDMDRAVVLSKAAGGLRLVTLEGEVINSGGAITGGRYKNSTANLLSRKSEVNRLTEQIKACEQEEDGLKADRGRLDAERSLVKEKADGLGIRAKALEMDVYRLDTQISAFEGFLSDAEEAKSRRNRERESLEYEMKNNSTLTAKLEGEIEDMRSKISEISSAIEEKSGKLEAMKSQVSHASEAITAARMDLNTAETTLENDKRLQSRVLSQIKDYREQIAQRKDELEQNEREKISLLSGGGGSEERFKAISEEIAEAEAYIARVSEERRVLSESLSRLEEEQKGFGERVNVLQDQKYQNDLKMAKNETQLDNMKSRLWEDFEITYAQARELKTEDFAMQPAIRESREIKDRLRAMGDVNVGSIKEFEQVSGRHGFLTEQREDLLKARDELLEIIDSMDKKIRIRFKENFDKVVVNFESVFKELFGGGHAKLSLDNENDPLESGIEIVAQPPGKKLENINLMSGGEKTMTAIALMFAVLKTKPTPFCILDEVEAALDDSNIDMFLKYLRRYEDVQFTIITHQKASMAHADVLYGVTMPESGVSKVLSLRMGDQFEL